MSQYISFETDHLLAKHGFADGELLEELLLSNGYEAEAFSEEAWADFLRRTLCEVLELYVLPKIRNSIKPYRMMTSHNPMRIYELDGQRVEDLPAGLHLEPHSVEVDRQKVLDVAQSLFENRFDDQGEPLSYLIRSPRAQTVFKSKSW